MISSEIRARARESLKDKWGKVALLTLFFALVVYVFYLVLNYIPIIGPIGYVIISPCLSYGFLASLIKIKRNEEVGYTDFLSICFNYIGKVWGVLGNIIKKLLIPLILIVLSSFAIVSSGILSLSGIMYSTNYFTSVNYFSSSFTDTTICIFVVALIVYIIAAIYATIKGYLYALSYYILYDNPDMSGKDIVEKSASLMKGNRWRFFWLGLTFIGWLILSAFTLYIGLLWLLPYMMISFICFYENLAGVDSSVSVDTTDTQETHTNE